MRRSEMLDKLEAAIESMSGEVMDGDFFRRVAHKALKTAEDHGMLPPLTLQDDKGYVVDVAYGSPTDGSFTLETTEPTHAWDDEPNPYNHWRPC